MAQELRDSTEGGEVLGNWQWGEAISIPGPEGAAGHWGSSAVRWLCERPRARMGHLAGAVAEKCETCRHLAA